LVRGTKP